MKKILSYFLLLLLSIYQSAAYLLGGKHCKFQPSCSEFAKEAIQKHGSAKGILLTIRRLFSCHPFSKGGFDPVP